MGARIALCADAHFLKIACWVAVSLIFAALPAQPNGEWEDTAVRCDAVTLESLQTDALAEDQLNKGEVVVQLVEENNIKFVVGRIVITDSPQNIWPVLVNPFEFERRISPRMKKVEVLQDDVNKSVLKCSVDVCVLFPSITYVVESKYEQPSTVQFRRVGGTLKDFRGCWLLKPRKDGQSTEVFYSMYIDPGIPVPRWLVREAVKGELPRTLKGLRTRILQQDPVRNSAPTRTINAAHALDQEDAIAAGKGSI